MKDLFNFLRELANNNSKEWMDQNRARYHQVRNDFIDWLGNLDKELQRIDPEYVPTPGRSAIHRINNNLMFHPDKPVYKNHFGATMDRVKRKSDFYLHFGINECFIGIGYYHPSSNILQLIREAIDYDGEELQRILEKDDFQNSFGSLETDAMLKTSPKGFSKEHPHIDLLRYKSFAAMHPLSEKSVCSPNFMKEVIRLYKLSMPFRHYLNKAVFFDEKI